MFNHEIINYTICWFGCMYIASLFIESIVPHLHRGGARRKAALQAPRTVERHADSLHFLCSETTKMRVNKGKLVDFRVTDDCHGQHSHRHVNHIIMSTTSSSSSRGSVTGRERVNSGLRALSGAKPYVFSGKMVFRGRRGGPRSAKVVDNKCTGLYSESSIHTKIAKN